MVHPILVPGHVFVAGYLATILVSAVRNTILAGGLSAIGAALFSIGSRKDTVVQYEAGMQAGIFRVMARGARDDIARANKLLDL
jgi:hypothetical protein